MPLYSINGPRLNQTLEELGHLGESSDGMDRVAYSPEDVLGRDYSINLMKEAGLETRIDTAGNIIGRVNGVDNSLPQSLSARIPILFRRVVNTMELSGSWQLSKSCAHSENEGITPVIPLTSSISRTKKEHVSTVGLSAAALCPA